MLFSEVLGQEFNKKHLTQSADLGRIPHAQLFVGPEGSGTLSTAIAYAQYVLCGNTMGENNGENSSCNSKLEKFSHPDLHFVYPTTTTDEVKKNPRSIDFIAKWRDFLIENPYGSLMDWYNELGVDNKQGQIRVDDAQEIVRALSLKAYEGGYKVMIVWMADKMNIEASNKLLKLLEEPPEKTVFILITESEEALIQTIRSRCQVLHFNALPHAVVVKALVDKQNMPLAEATKIAHQAQGNYNKALQLLKNGADDYPFEKWFVTWVRAAYKAKKDVTVLHDLMAWSDEISSLGREAQKAFLHYCIEMFRQALLLNYSSPDLVYIMPKEANFKLENFAPFVHGNNIDIIFKELSDAIYHIERNGNAKIILTDLSIKLTRLFHKK